jgi:hypothetical protein
LEFRNFTHSLQSIPLLSSPTASSSNSPVSSALDAADGPCYLFFLARYRCDIRPKVVSRDPGPGDTTSFGQLHEELIKAVSSSSQKKTPRLLVPLFFPISFLNLSKVNNDPRFALSHDNLPRVSAGPEKKRQNYNIHPPQTKYEPFNNAIVSQSFVIRQFLFVFLLVFSLPSACAIVMPSNCRHHSPQPLLHDQKRNPTIASSLISVSSAASSERSWCGAAGGIGCESQVAGLCVSQNPAFWQCYEANVGEPELDPWPSSPSESVEMLKLELGDNRERVAHGAVPNARCFRSQVFDTTNASPGDQNPDIVLLNAC